MALRIFVVVRLLGLVFLGMEIRRYGLGGASRVPLFLVNSFSLLGIEYIKPPTAIFYLPLSALKQISLDHDLLDAGNVFLYQLC